MRFLWNKSFGASKYYLVDAIRISITELHHTPALSDETEAFDEDDRVDKQCGFVGSKRP